MTSTERVKRAIAGDKTDRVPIYGWVSGNLNNEISAAYGSVETFEDQYEFDAAHLFGGPGAFDDSAIERIRQIGDELTPAMLLAPVRTP